MVTFSQNVKRTVMFLGLLSVGSSAVHAAKYSVQEVASIFAQNKLGATSRLAGIKAQECFNSLNTHLNAFASGTPKRRGSITRQSFTEMQRYMQTQPQATLETFQNLKNTYNTKFALALAENKDLAAIIANFDAKLAQVVSQMQYASTESVLSPGLVQTKKTRARRRPSMVPVRLNFDLEDEEEFKGVFTVPFIPHCGPVVAPVRTEDLTGLDVKYPVQMDVDMDVEMVEEPVIPAPVVQTAPLLSYEYIRNVVMNSEAWAKQVWLFAPSRQEISKWWATQQAAK